MAPNDPYAQHVVTAVIVGHDGAAWLGHGIDALLAQTKRVQRVVAVDTGSRDRSGSVLTAKLGQHAVFGMDRSTGYGVAVRRALQHKAASGPVADGGGSRAGAQQVEWIWLLHDDCEPAPDALEQLLRGAAETPTAAVLGPKLKDWTNRDVILEAGLGLDSVGRRITGIESREVDQGQHDGDRDVLAVSTAGMLIRRDVWDHVGGFDPGMTLFGEDLDLCWRVHGAGYRVRVITDAVVYHVMAATRGRRAISVGRRARLLDRRHNLQTLLGNLPTGPMLVSLAANLTISLIRTLFYMVAKRGTAALDEAAAVAAVVGHPLRFAAARRRRSRGRRSAYSQVRPDLSPGRSVRRAAEFLALALSRSATAEHAARRSAIDDPTDDDSLLTDTGFVQRFITRPGVLLMLGVIIVAAVAERSLFGGGPLGGGALLPAWEGASTLWGEVLRAFHPSGVGTASAAPPYAGFVALLASILLGKVWLAIDVLLLGAVPLACLTALFALQRVTASPRLRVWGAASYALLPVAFGAVAAGRLGSAVAFILIPLIGLQAGRMYSEPPRRARRAAWATALVTAIATAFVPLIWPMSVAAAVIAAVTLPRTRPRLINLGIVVAAPPVLLLPWMLEQIAHPGMLLLEAGVQQPGLASTMLPARSLLLLSPGGPGLPPYWVSAALLVTGLAALLATGRRLLVMAGWSVALLGYATAVLVSRTVVTPVGGQAMTPWPGAALAVAAAGLLLAAVAGAEGIGRTVTARGRKASRRPGGMRRLAIVVLSLAGASAPLLAAAYWVADGVAGPIGQATGQVVPPLAGPSATAGDQLRTLVLTSEHGRVSYLLLRGDSPELADSGLVPASAAQTALNRTVGALVAPGGDQAASQSQLLAHFDIGFVLVRAPINQALVSVLDEVDGLTPYSISAAFDTWQVTPTPSRVSVVEPDGAVVPVTSGAIGVSGAAVPSSGGTLELAEPAGGWSASVNGHPLTPIPSPAGSWAQAFRLPPGGGTLTISRSALMHDLLVVLELLAFVIVAALALPGVRTAAELQAATAASEAEATGAAEAEDGEKPAAGTREEPARGPDRTAVPVRTGLTDGAGSPGEADLPARARLAGRAASLGRAETHGGAETLGEAEASGRADPAGRAVPAGRSAGAAPDSAARDGRAGGVRDRIGRRRQAAQDDAESPDTGKRGAGRPRRGAGRAAAALADTGRAAGRRARAGLPRGAAGRAADTAGDAGGAGAAGAAGASGAWPAGQPASRFVGGPPRGSYRPDSGEHGNERYRDTPARGRPSPPELPPADRRSRSGPSPSGPRHGDMPAGSPYDSPRGPGRPSRPRSPSGTPPDELAAPGYGDSRRSREAAAGWREPERTTDQRRRRRDPDPLGADWREPGQPGRRADRGWEQERDHGWPGADQPSRHAASEASAWPEPAGRRGRPRQAGPDPGAPEWHVPDQGGWPEQGESLEALPPIAEVHHDWPRREDRSRRGWVAPEDEQDGETW